MNFKYALLVALVGFTVLAMVDARRWGRGRRHRRGGKMQKCQDWRWPGTDECEKLKESLGTCKTGLKNLDLLMERKCKMTCGYCQTTSKPEDDATKPEDDSTKPEDDATKPDDDGTKPENDGTKPEDDATEREDDDTEPEDDGTKPEDDDTVPEDVLREEY